MLPRASVTRSSQTWWTRTRWISSTDRAPPPCRLDRECMNMREINNVHHFQSVKVVLSPGAKPSPPLLCATSCLAGAKWARRASREAVWRHTAAICTRMTSPGWLRQAIDRLYVLSNDFVLANLGCHAGAMEALFGRSGPRWRGRRPPSLGTGENGADLFVKQQGRAVHVGPQPPFAPPSGLRRAEAGGRSPE